MGVSLGRPGGEKQPGGARGPVSSEQEAAGRFEQGREVAHPRVSLPRPGMSERERQVMKKLKEVVDKQRDEIRAKDRELGLKNEDVEAVSDKPPALPALPAGGFHPGGSPAPRVAFCGLRGAGILPAAWRAQPETAAVGGPQPSRHRNGRGTVAQDTTQGPEPLHTQRGSRGPVSLGSGPEASPRPPSGPYASRPAWSRPLQAAPGTHAVSLPE